MGVCSGVHVDENIRNWKEVNTMEHIKPLAETLAAILAKLLQPDEAIMVLSQARQIIERSEKHDIP